MSEPTVVHETITPELAELYLQANIDHNRAVSTHRVEAYARDMANGRWKLSAESIKFNTDGKLFDGQHRLWAVIEAGVPVRMTVARDVDPEAVHVIDAGRPRSAVDSLHINEHELKNASIVVSAAQITAAYYGGVFVHSSSAMSGSTRMTNSELREYVIANEAELGTAAQEARRTAGHLRLQPSVIAATYFLLHRVDAEMCDEFFERIRSGKSDGVGDPVFVLVKRAADDRFAGRTITQGLGLFYILRAWRAFRDGEKLTKLQATHSGGPTFVPPIG